MDNKARKAYDLIQEKANSSMFVEGLSGVAGFPWTVLADSAIVFTHYAPMVEEIRKIYGRSSITTDTLLPMMTALKEDIVADILLDQIAGQIPLIGIYFNLICAKAMTWRIGLLFALVSSRGDAVDIGSLQDAMRLIRQLSPQSGIFKFNQPRFEDFRTVEASVRDKSISTYKDILAKVLSNMAKGKDVKHMKLSDL